MAEERITIPIEVPKGAVLFCNIYQPPEGVNREAMFGMLIPASCIPSELLDGVKISTRQGTGYIHVNSRMRPEVHIGGDFDAEDPSRFEWLRYQHELLDLRNLRRDALFRDHPLRLELFRYSLNPNARGGNHTVDADGKAYAFTLERLTILAKDQRRYERSAK